MRRFAGAATPRRLKPRRLVEGGRPGGRPLLALGERKGCSVQEHLDVARMLIVAVEGDARQRRRRRGVPALDETLARRHRGPDRKLSCELEFTLPGTALVAVGIAEVSARFAKFALDALKAIGDL